MSGLETVFTSAPELIAACLILALATAVYVLLGFGSGLIALGTLALVLPDLRDVVVLLLLVSLPPELWVVATSRRFIQWRGALLILAGIAAGVPLGALMLGSGDPGVLLLLLGSLLIAAGVAFLLVLAHPSWRWPAWSQPPLGLVSGALSGLFGAGGPPLILFYQLAGVDKAAFRGNLMALFLAMTLVRLPSYALAGMVTPARLWSALLVMPAVLVGMVVGHRVHLRVDEHTFRRVVSIALVVLGVVLIARRVL